MLCIKKEIVWNSNAHLVWKGHKDKGQAAKLCIKPCLYISLQGFCWHYCELCIEVQNHEIPDGAGSGLVLQQHRNHLLHQQLHSVFYIWQLTSTNTPCLSVGFPALDLNADDIKEQWKKKWRLTLAKGSNGNLNTQCSVCKTLRVGFVFAPCMQSVWKNKVFCMSRIAGYSCWKKWCCWECYYL